MISGIMATVIFVRDLARCTAFYRDVLKLPYAWSDADSSTFHLQGQILTLLSVSGAADLLGSDPHALKIEGNPRVVLAAGVEDVDATYEALLAEGVRGLRPPTEQPWGMRTAHFADPEGNIWEINHPLASQ